LQKINQRHRDVSVLLFSLNMLALVVGYGIIIRRGDSVNCVGEFVVAEQSED
jgi:hypothetical protein